MTTDLPATVALTGASGLIGRRLVPALLQAGVHVRVLSRTPQHNPHPAYTSIPGDLGNTTSLHTLVQHADAVIHLAGVAHTELNTPAEEATAAAVNVGGTRALHHASTSAGVPHFLYFSSAHIYAGQQGTDLHEDSPTDTGTGYAGMKRQAEDLLHAEASSAQTMTVLRPCLTYGPGVRFNLHRLMRAVQAGRYVHPGGADVLRSFASVDTIAAAVLHLLHSRCPGTYNLADREPQSLQHWVNGLASYLGARQPGSVPIRTLRCIAAVGSAARRIGLPAPITTAALRKLTAPFTLNVDRLASTGFLWPGTQKSVLADMVADFQSATPAAGTHA